MSGRGLARAPVLAVVLAVVASACTGGVGPSAHPAPTLDAVTGSDGGGTSAPLPGSGDPPIVPAPDEDIPGDASTLALALTHTTRALERAIDSWLAEDPRALHVPEDVELFALYQQRVTRVLARDPALAERVIPRLPASVAALTQANVEASARLFSHARPVRDATALRTQPPAPAGTLLGYYREAEQRFGVAREVLAAVNSIESRFGRVRSSSYAGAQGPMQFLPSTWDAYGIGGDVHDPHDAILGAANYLASSGAPEDYRAALYHYNPVNDYVAAVMLYAKQMMRAPWTYYAYYDWQVFVFTKQGEVLLTGPGT